VTTSRERRQSTRGLTLAKQHGLGALAIVFVEILVRTRRRRASTYLGAK
jgi:hypothetical protein